MEENEIVNDNEIEVRGQSVQPDENRPIEKVEDATRTIITENEREITPEEQPATVTPPFETLKELEEENEKKDEAEEER